MKKAIFQLVVEFLKFAGLVAIIAAFVTAIVRIALI